MTTPVMTDRPSTRVLRTRRTMTRVALLPLLAILSATAPADTITVCASGCDYTSINEAIAAASDGDVIQLAAETYQEGEQIEIHGRSLAILGPANPDGEPLAIIDGQNEHRVLNAVDSNLTLDQVTITRGYAASDGRWLGGGGVRTASSSIVIRDCVIMNSIGGPGGGIHLEQSTSEILRCRVTGNSTLDWSGEFPAGGGGGGVSQSAGVLTVTHCEIQANYAGMGSGGAIESDGKLLIHGCTLEGYGDDAIGYGETPGGLSCTQVQMSDTIIKSSSRILSGTVFNSEFRDFRGPAYYGGCSCCSSDAPGLIAGFTQFRDCLFSNLRATNTSPVSGGRSYENCVFMNNSSGAGGYGAGGSRGGALRTSGSKTNLSSCLFLGNRAVYGGALYASDITIMDCEFTSNVSYSNPDGACVTPETGGGGAVLGYNCEFVSCLFKDNESSGPGSAINGEGNAVSDSSFCGRVTDWIEGQWQDLGDNTFAITCPSPCPGDFDGDGLITGADLGAWLPYAGDACDPGTPCPGDLDGDGEVRGSDLGLLLANWGLCP